MRNALHPLTTLTQEDRPSASCLYNDGFQCSLQGSSHECLSGGRLRQGIVSQSTPNFEHPASSNECSSTGSSPLSRPIPVQRTEMVGSLTSSIHNNYDITEKIGQGTWGTVHVARERQTGTERAVKKMSKRFTTEFSRFRQEISILRDIDHPSICRLLEVYEDYAYLYMILEYCRGGDLFSKITEVKRFKEEDVAIIMKQILSALYYCHRKGVCHRDLKPENFLYVTDAPDSPIRLVDFGLAKKFSLRGPVLMKTKVGTMYFVAPEVLEGSYSEKCDVWSAGVILYLLLLGVPPFGGDSDASIAHNVMKSEPDFENNMWHELSPAVVDLCRLMLTREPEKRLSAEQALQHYWFQQSSPQMASILRSVSYPDFQKGRASILRNQSAEYLTRTPKSELSSPSENSKQFKTLGDFSQQLAARDQHQQFSMLHDVSTVAEKCSTSIGEVSSADDSYMAVLSLELMMEDMLQCWRQFARKTSLQRALMNIVARFSEDTEKLQRYRTLFTTLDLNGDGCLDQEELIHGLKAVVSLQKSLSERKRTPVSLSDMAQPTAVAELSVDSPVGPSTIEDGSCQTQQPSPDTSENEENSSVVPSLEPLQQGYKHLLDGPDQDPIQQGGSDMESEIIKLFPYIDISSTGVIEYSEFVASVTDSKDPNPIRAAFRILDRDSDGKISVPELRASLGWSKATFYPTVQKLTKGIPLHGSGPSDEEIVEEMLTKVCDDKRYITSKKFTELVTE